MTVRELKKVLEQFEDSKEVFIFAEDIGVLTEAQSVSDNNGHVQINCEVE